MSEFGFVSHIAAPLDAEGPAYWFLLQKGRLLLCVADGEDGVEIPWIEEPAALGLAPVRQLYIGQFQDQYGTFRHCYAAEIEADATLPDSLVAEGMRELYPRLGDALFNIAGRANQILTWDRDHQFCGRCATPVEMLDFERAKKCPNCGLTSYPRLSPAIIIAVVRETDRGRRLLLARNHRFPAGRYSVIAGFVEPGESLEECARREVMEEVGIGIKNIRYFGSQSWPFPHSLMVGFTAEYAQGEFALEPEEITDAQWFAADALPTIPTRPSISRMLIDWFVEGESG